MESSAQCHRSLDRSTQAGRVRWGQSLWDRSLVYVATDFGRTKVRPENSPEFGSGHDLNNGSSIISPMANGGSVLGGVDPDTAMTYRIRSSVRSARSRTHNDRARIICGILQAMGVDTAPGGLPSMRAMVRSWPKPSGRFSDVVGHSGRGVEASRAPPRGDPGSLRMRTRSGLR